MTSDPGALRPASSPAPGTPDVPPAFAREGAPYTLDELLSGLPPLAEDGAARPAAPAQTAECPQPQPEAPAPQDVPPPAAEQDADAASAPGEDTDGAWDPSILTAENVVAALHALAEDCTPTEAGGSGDDVRVPSGSRYGEDEQALASRVSAIIAANLPEGGTGADRGNPSLPERLDCLALLLAQEPPAQDFAALDALYACWPRATQDHDSRALLAVALNLSRNFGLPGRLPMAATRAWRMLSATVFEAELAQQLRQIETFIAEWQSTRRTFLILEFGEVELIEYLFEALHPGHHADLLARVMNFKVLSNRRMGLLRRIPTRLKKKVAGLLPAEREQALIELAHAKALLELIGTNGFVPIAEAADKALEDVEKMMKAAANAGAAPSPGLPGGNTPLGRIG